MYIVMVISEFGLTQYLKNFGMDMEPKFTFDKNQAYLFITYAQAEKGAGYTSCVVKGNVQIKVVPVIVDGNRKVVSVMTTPGYVFSGDNLNLSEEVLETTQTEKLEECSGVANLSKDGFQCAELEIGGVVTKVQSNQAISSVETTLNGIKVTFGVNQPRTWSLNMDGKQLAKVREELCLSKLL